MVRMFLITKIVFLMSVSAWAGSKGVQKTNPQTAKTDLAWSDVGDDMFKVSEEVRGQRDYSSISKDEGLMPVGSFIRMAQDVNLRAAPGGSRVKPVLKGEDFQVLEVIVDNKGKRYYKVKSGKDIGYVYAGTKVSYPRWTKQTWSSVNKVIAEPGDIIKVKRHRGLKISKSVDAGKHFYSIPKNSKVQVESVIQDKDGKLYYKVKYKSRAGFAKVADSDEIAKVKNWSEVY